MSFLKWLKENVFDWSPMPISYGSRRPPSHPPGWKNIQREKRANNASNGRDGTHRGSSGFVKSATAAQKKKMRRSR